MDIHEIAGRFGDCRRSGSAYKARCPMAGNHNNGDRNPSLSIWNDKEGNVAVCCKSQGCNQDDILAAVGLTWHDLKDSGYAMNTTPKLKPTNSEGKPKVQRTFYNPAKHVATYRYTDADGKYLCEKRRDSDKNMAWFHDGKSGNGGHDVVYRLHNLVASDQGDPIYLCEGENDADRLANEGYETATSLPSTGAWRDEYTEYFEGRDVVLLMDNDTAGDKAADKLSLALLPIVRTLRRVSFAHCEIEPSGYDVSDFLDEHAVEDFDALVESAPLVEPTAADTEDAGRTTKNRPSIADRLVKLALEKYRLGRTDKGEVFAVENDGPNVAVMLKGSAKELRARLSKNYRYRYQKTPNASALKDALCALEGEAMDTDPESVQLRVASHDGGIVIDLGSNDGRAVFVGRDGWKLLDRSPVLFRRTELTSPLPVPAPGGSLDDLRNLLNVNEGSWPLVIGWLVSVFMPEIPHPILFLNGLQGTGKSSAARVLLSLVDPSGAPLRSEPRDIQNWQTTASGSWVVCIDNISKIAPWLSDTLCRAVTGDGQVQRKLYTDSDISVVAFRRAIILTSIDTGAIRGDLGERMMIVDVDQIGEDSRRTEHELESLLESHRPAILGALLDAVAAALAKLPEIKPAKLPRMADFGRVLMATDNAGVTSGAFDLFIGQQGRIAAEVVDADSFGRAVLGFARLIDRWQGTASELLCILEQWVDDESHSGWPGRNGVSGRLKRLMPPLAALGVFVSFSRENSPQRTRLIEITARKDLNQHIQNRLPGRDGMDVMDKVDNPSGQFNKQSLPANGNRPAARIKGTL